MSIISNSDSLTENDLLRQGFGYARDQDLDTTDEDLEALGAARYVEQIVTGERDDYSLDDLVEYMAAADDFNFDEFQQYKEEMANDYSIFGDKVVEKLQELEESRNRYEAQGHLFQSLYEEVRQERDSAAQALQTIFGYDFDEEIPGEPETGSPFNFNMGNQVLGDLPFRNLNLGNQVLVEDLEDRSSQASQSRNSRENFEELYEWWDEEMDTGNPDQL